MWGRQVTKRPENECRTCGRTWYPRGSDYSANCPKCGSVEVADAAALSRQREDARRAERERLEAQSRAERERLAVKEYAETVRQIAEQKEREYLRVAADLGLPQNADRRILDFEVRRRRHLANLPPAIFGAASVVTLASFSLPANKMTMLAVGLISTLFGGAVLFGQLSKPKCQLTEGSPWSNSLSVVSALAVTLHCATYLVLRNYPGSGPIGLLIALYLAGNFAVLVHMEGRRLRSASESGPAPPDTTDHCVSIDFCEDSIATVNMVWVGPATSTITEWVEGGLWSASMARPAANGTNYVFPKRFACGSEVIVGIYDLPTAPKRMKLNGFPDDIDWRVVFLDGAGTQLAEISSALELRAGRICAFPRNAARAIVVPPGRHKWTTRVMGVQLSVRSFPPDPFREAKAGPPPRSKYRTPREEAASEEVGSSARQEERPPQGESKPAARDSAAESRGASGPHAVLGVSRTASPSEIRSAYLLRCKEYHPDKVAHLGVKLREAAEHEMKEIQLAYDLLGRPR